MPSRAQTNYFIILAVFVIGLAVTVTLQLVLIKAKAKEERYEFESQVSNLTLFVTDNLNQIVNQFNLLAKMAAVSDSFNNDNYLARFSQLSFQQGRSPITFAILGKDKQTGRYDLRHMSGKYAAQENRNEIAKEVESAMLWLVHSELKT
jgi:hypothetical protein